MRAWSLLILFLAPTSLAADFRAVSAAADAAFDRMPDVKIVARIEGECGANSRVNPFVAYCTSQNSIYLSEVAAESEVGAYLVAHAMGHAAQVRHGVADQALAAIRSRPSEERQLRGMVTRQVECLAGLFFALSGADKAQLSDWFQTEPFTGSHWGRDPLRIGPRVSIGLDQRNEWFVRGQIAHTPADCSVGEMSAELLVRAFKG